MERRLLISGLLAVAAFAQIHVATAQSFPHLGAVLVGGNIDFVNVPHIGDVDVALFTNYPGYSAGGKTFAQQVTAVKALNPNIKILPQGNIMEVPSYQESSSDPHYPRYLAINNNNWWLRSAYPGGSIVTDTASASAVNVMTTTLSSAGQTYLQWMAAWTVSFSIAIAPNVDGIHTDNWFYQPRNGGDYLQNGTSQSASAVAQGWRNAYVEWAAQLRKAMGPNYMVTGNVADWRAGNFQGYNQVLNGGVIEGAIGQSWSPESSSWSNLMTTYASDMKAMAPFNGGGPYLIFNQDGSLTDYQGMRYGLGSCLLDNGYFYYTTGPYNTIAWFDELGVKLGAPTAGPNNPTNGTYSSGGLTVWQNGVWRRDFANGIVLVNPKGNGGQTVTLETTYKHFSGSQDPSTNNGQSVTSVTLNDRDGVILLRLTSQTSQPAVPDAPTLISVQ
jgi:hypothetical protein